MRKQGLQKPQEQKKQNDSSDKTDNPDLGEKKKDSNVSSSPHCAGANGFAMPMWR